MCAKINSSLVWFWSLFTETNCISTNPIENANKTTRITLQYPNSFSNILIFCSVQLSVCLSNRNRLSKSTSTVVLLRVHSSYWQTRCISYSYMFPICDLSCEADNNNDDINMFMCQLFRLQWIVMSPMGHLIWDQVWKISQFSFRNNFISKVLSIGPHKSHSIMMKSLNNKHLSIRLKGTKQWL